MQRVKAAVIALTMTQARELPALLPQSEVPRVYSRIAPVYDV